MEMMLRSFLQRSAMALAILTVAMTTRTEPAGAQKLDELQPGARIRFRAPGVVAGRVTATVLRRSPDTLFVAEEDRTLLSVPVRSISAVDVSRGTSHGLGAWKGAAWGAGIGLVLGPVAALDSTSSGGKQSVGESMVFTSVGGAVIGAIIGGVMGSERWDSFELPSRVGIALGADRVLLCIALRR